MSTEFKPTLKPPSELFQTSQIADKTTRPPTVSQPAVRPKPTPTETIHLSAAKATKAQTTVPLFKNEHPPQGQLITTGVWLDTHHKTKEGATVRVVTVDPTRVKVAPIFHTDGHPLHASALKNQKNLIVAINSQFFHNQGLVGDVQTGSQRYLDDTNTNVDKISDQRYYIAIDTTGKIQTGQGGLSETGQTFQMFMGGLPCLFAKGQHINLEKDIQSGAFAKRSSYGGAVAHDSISRSFIGVTADGKLLLVAAGTGSQRSKGISLEEGGRLLKRIGAVEAYVLDGGGSTSLYVKDHADLRTDGRQVKAYVGVWKNGR